MTETPPPPAERTRDWRLFATSTLAKPFHVQETGEVLPEGSRVTVCSVLQISSKKRTVIPLPNATALLLHASSRAYAAARAIRDHSGIDSSAAREVSLGSEGNVFDYIEYSIEAIILAFTAVEAFANQTIPHDYVATISTKNGDTPEKLTKTEIERRLSTDEKLSSVLPQALQVRSPRGSRCWQDFRSLKKVRDRVIHMKSADTKSAGQEEDTVWKEIFQLPCPHRLALSIIEHFVKQLPARPYWHGRFSE